MVTKQIERYSRGVCKEHLRAKKYPTMVIKSIHTFVTTSTVFAEFAYLQHEKFSW